MARSAWRVAYRLLLAGLSAILVPRGLIGQRPGQVLEHRVTSAYNANPNLWWLRDVPIFVPLRAESRSDATKVVAGDIGAYPYAEGDGARTGMDISVGTEIPLIGWGLDRTLVATPGRWVVGLWLPISFHMLWDLTSETSRPIVNTDYGFSLGLLKARYGMSPCFSVHARLRPYAHESSHLGDELVLSASKRFGSEFERVNVSQWYSEAGAGFTWEHSTDRVESRVTARSGVYRQWSGYYDEELLTGGTATPSRRRDEWYGQAEYTRGWIIVSAEARNRIVYDYHRLPDAREQTRISWNVVVGVGDPNRPDGLARKTDVVLRWYEGVNPHGQLRSQRSYRILGVGLHLGT
jgi:hypothetical protein